MRSSLFSQRTGLLCLPVLLCVVLLLGHPLPASAEAAPTWSLLDPNGQSLAAIVVDQPQSSAPPRVKLQLNAPLLRFAAARHKPILLVDGQGQTRSLVHIVDVIDLGSTSSRSGGKAVQPAVSPGMAPAPETFAASEPTR